jgi:hypothetical protein
MEVSLWRSKERATEMTEKASAHKREFGELRNQLAPLVQAAGEIPGVKKLWDRFQQQIQEPELSESSSSSGGDEFEAELNRAFSSESLAEKKSKAEEANLCALRDFLVNAWELPEVKSRFSALKDFMEAQIAKQALHREDDRNTWLAWLEEKKSTNEWLVKDAEEEEDKTRYELRLQKINQEIKRVTGMSPRQILMDCTLFGRNPKDFDPFGM